MELSKLHVRFFRSFNYDFELKARLGSKAEAWEDGDPAWFPFVEIDLERDITAVVGSNEAGKSQLLLAIEAAINGKPIKRADFCRYSELYSVQSGEVRMPEFGATFELGESDTPVRQVAALATADRFTLIRPGGDDPFVVVNQVRHELTEAEVELITDALPSVHRLVTDVAIPDSVSIARLASDSRYALTRRSSRLGLLKALVGMSAKSDLQTLVAPFLESGEVDEARKKREEQEFVLARNLLIVAAKIDPSEFRELLDAIQGGREGEVEAITGGMNAAIRENLNIQRWWSQDKQFDLLVEAREHELVFTIRDRTKSTYSFAERSQGLRYFLSYFVQLVAHRAIQKYPDILLLDEPDAFLSSVGQQDLLRVLDEFAVPEGGGPSRQVVYVTHSPFLIDRNAPHRIRVLDKGAEDAGTRVVKDAANNRYEPLRSSIGPNVSELAFIGGHNLFVEGIADQIYIAGIASHLAGSVPLGARKFDLNQVTIVPCGGADGIPYMVYLARGRDAIKPSCVALLDGDEAGKRAEKVLRSGEARRKRVLKDEYIARLDLWAAESGLVFDVKSVTDIEDLIPTAAMHRAALNYLARFTDLSEMPVADFKLQSIQNRLKKPGVGMWAALTEEYSSAFAGEHLEKAGLAREVVNLLDPKTIDLNFPEIDERFRSLLDYLAVKLDEAFEEEERNRLDDRLQRAVRNFGRNYQSGIRKIEAQRVVREIKSALGAGAHADALRQQVVDLERRFELEDLSSATVGDFGDFKEAIRALGAGERIAYQDDSKRDPAAMVLGSGGLDADSPGTVGTTINPNDIDPAITGESSEEQA